LDCLLCSISNIVSSFLNARLMRLSRLFSKSCNNLDSCSVSFLLSFFLWSIWMIDFSYFSSMRCRIYCFSSRACRSCSSAPESTSFCSLRVFSSSKRIFSFPSSCLSRSSMFRSCSFTAYSSSSVSSSLLFSFFFNCCN